MELSQNDAARVLRAFLELEAEDRDLIVRRIKTGRSWKRLAAELGGRPKDVQSQYTLLLWQIVRAAETAQHDHQKPQDRGR